MAGSTKRKPGAAGAAKAAPAAARALAPAKPRTAAPNLSTPAKSAPARKTAATKPAKALPVRSSPIGTAPSLRASLEKLRAEPASRKAAAPSAKAGPKAAPFVRKPVLQELEARLLLSADLNPAAQDTLLATPAMQGAEFRALAEPSAPTVVTSMQVAPIHRTNELVFVDTQTPEYLKLIEQMRAAGVGEGRQIEFVLIDGSKDGIRRITDTLAQRSDLDAIHIVSHATDGAVQLGSAQLDFETLVKRAAAIKKWGDALTENGDILFYGCDLAATQEGKSLIDALARLTGADVAASDDPTGAAKKGGDWDLEFKSGAIEANVVVSLPAQREWDHLLAAVAVTGTTDLADGNTTSIANLIATPGADGFISLREAITAANNTAGLDTITFNIGGGPGVKTINVGAIALPSITDAVVLDATTQAGWAVGALMVEINGAGIANRAGVADAGLHLTAGSDGSTIRGFIINRVGVSADWNDGSGIFADSTSSIVVAGNWLGLDAAGTGDPGAQRDGIQIAGTTDTTIGGLAAADRNVVSGNDRDGIRLVDSDDNLVIGNWVGLNKDGDDTVRNTYEGIHLRNGADNNTIGGTAPGARNVVTGNDGGGIRISGQGSVGPQYNVVQGNYFGTDVSGTGTLGSGSGFNAIEIDNGASYNTIGGVNPGEGNILAYSWDDNISVTDETPPDGAGPHSTGNAFLGNANFAADTDGGGDGNGIDLLRNWPADEPTGNHQATANDLGDGDSGYNAPNELQNYPVLTLAVSDGTQIGIRGTLNSLANTNFRIEFFSNAGTDATGLREGAVYLGAANVTTDAAGNVTFNVAFAGNVPVGRYITATATRANASFTQFYETSEFSQDDEIVVAGSVISGTIFEDVDGDADVGEAGTQRAAGATVRLFRDNATVGTPEAIGTDPLLQTVTTDASGNYAFIGLGNGNYWVAVDSKTIAPSAGYNAGYTIADVWAEQTYGDNSTTALLDLGARYGGRSGTAATADNAAAANTAEHLSRVNIAGGTSVTGVNYGFSFSAVTNTDGDNVDDDGAKAGIQQQGSLRQAITNSNAIAGVQSVNFSVGSGAISIAPTAVLPTITDAVVLDATSQEGFVGTPLVQLRGDSAPGTASGLMVNSAGASTVRGFVINRFGSVGIVSQAGTGHVIAGNIIGTDTANTAGIGNSEGITISNTTNVTIGGALAADMNVISGNVDEGIITSNVDGTVIRGNRIGTNIAGTAARGNGWEGIQLWTNSANVTIRDNLISGNGRAGIRADSAGSTGTIFGNIIGLNAAGTAAIGNAAGNSEGGIYLASAGAFVIGGTTAAERNVISGNTGSGITLDASNGTTILGNYIGTDINGTADLGNTVDGVLVTGNSNTIGGSVAGARNVISGNNDDGVDINGGDLNVVSGNYIGIQANGTLARANSDDGIDIRNGAQNNTIGGTTALERNVISGNNDTGVFVRDATSTGNIIRGNYIGTDVTGTADLGNGVDGITIFAPNSTIGGTASGAGNLISGNGSNGIGIAGAAAINTLIQGNYIGTNAAGTASLANTNNGVYVSGGGTTTVGGGVAGARNVISGNGLSGILIDTSSNNVVQGNYVGTNFDGTAAVSNNRNGGTSGDGIRLLGASNNTIGGTTALERNVISGNDSGIVAPFSWEHGIYLWNSDNNLIQGNYIGTNAAGTAAIRNFADGIGMDGDAGGGYSNSNTIRNNLLSGNKEYGIWAGAGSGGQIIQGNLIGTNFDGTAALGNGTGAVSSPNPGAGIRLDSSGNTIGGTVAGQGNVISGNAGAGIALPDASSDSNVIQGNYIGTDITGTVDLGNGGAGVDLGTGAGSNTIGGVGGAATRNVISGNSGDGIQIFGGGTTGNLVQGNYIGVDANGTADLGNSQSGVFIWGGGSSNTIGGGVAAAGNVISGNNRYGVEIDGLATGSNVVQANRIGTTADGSGPLGNALGGVTIGGGSSNNVIGFGYSAPNETGLGNTIAYNGGDGVELTGTNTTKGNRIAGNSIYANGSGIGDLGIDLGANGNGFGSFSQPDALPGYDVDAGPNGYQNYPEFTGTVTTNGTTLTVPGRLLTPTAGLINYRLHFYASAGPGPSGDVQSERYLGYWDVTNNPGGTRIFTATITAPVADGEWITMTATVLSSTNALSVAGDSSEFSGGVQAVALRTISGTIANDDEGDGSIAGDSGFQGVTVRLYQDDGDLAADSGDTLLQTAITGAGGTYSFANVTPGVTYWVVVDSKTIGQAGIAYNSGNYTGVWAEQTYGDNSATAGLDVGTRYGGRNLTLSDDAWDAGNLLVAPEHLARVDLGTADVANVDYGFSFVAITNARGDATDDDSSNLRTQQGTLRQFILNSNAIAGTQTSNFSIGGGGQQTISISGARLDNITDTVVLDATTQEGWVLAPLIEIEGSALAAGNDGLRLAAGANGSTIRGFAINRFTQHGINILNAGASGNTIVGNYIGVGLDGTTDRGNTFEGISVETSNNVIGGAGADRNVISGNNRYGIHVYGGDNNAIRNNLIGVAVDGTTMVGNTTAGIVLRNNGANGAQNNVVGGVGLGNVISANQNGISIEGAGTTGNIVQGNWIGTDATGTLDLGNTQEGIEIYSSAGSTTVGGTAAGEGNVISGNGFYGIRIDTSSNNVVQGNYIGTNGTATAALANGRDGILIQYASSGNTIGGAAVGAGNVIGGNLRSGILISSTDFTAGDDSPTNNVVQGNWIGTNAAGDNLGNTQFGVYVLGPAGAFDSPDNNVIGTTSAGASPIPEAGAGNVIAFNTLDGVRVEGGVDRTRIAGNSIHDNVRLGINLVGGLEDGFDTTSNDVTGTWDNDAGANRLQNWPVLTGAYTDGATFLTVQGQLQTLNGTYRVHFYMSAAADVSGHGEGEVYLGYTDVTVNGLPALYGTGVINYTFNPIAIPVGRQITATATDSNGNTSEFSLAVQTTTLQTISGTIYNDDEGDGAIGGDAGFVGATVRLYRDDGDNAPDGGDTLIATTATGAGGTYSFANVSSGSTYWVVVESKTLDAASIAGTVWADQTYGDDLTTAALDVAARYGGRNAAVSDNAWNGAGVLQAPEHVSRVVLGNADVAGVDSAFSFVAVTNNRGDTTDDDEPVNAGTARLQQGSLRQVILNANAIAGTQTVNFSVGTGQVTIDLSAGVLPAIDGTLFLDGRTQEGYSGTPLVLLDGNGAVGNGLTLTANADGSTIRGLIIRDFSVYGIEIQAGSDNNVVYGNYLGGLDFAGNDATIAEGNDGAGVRVDGSNNTIGSTTLADRNVISRNAGDGVYVGAGDANVIIGNYIGTNAAGNAVAANTDDGVNVYKNGATAATNTRIGGTGAGEGNLISGNLNYGIELAKSGVGGNGSGVTIQGNRIGTDAAGTAAIANGTAGILVSLWDNVTIGGTAANAGNTIAFNGGDGVTANTEVVTILGNSIFQNGNAAGLGIDLSGNSVTANDPGNPDNLPQNFPVISAVRLVGATVEVDFSLDSDVSQNYRIEFFSNPSTDPNEGRTFLDAVSITTNASGLYSGTAILTPAVLPVLGDRVTATATRDLGGGNYSYTSEFSAPALVAIPPVNTVPGAQTVAEDAAHAFSGGNTISVADSDGNLATTQLTVSNGVLNVTLAPGATISAGANGSATMTISGTQAAINATLASLTYQGNLNFNGADTLTVVSTDAASGSDTDTVSITVTAVNDAPTLDNAVSPALAAVAEDAPAPVGAVGTLVSALVDFPGGGGLDNVTDPDTGAVIGIAITATNSTNGTWWYSTDGGTNWLAVGAVADDNALLLAANGTTRLYFQPNADFSGTVANGISFRAWDQSTGSAGSYVDTTTNGGSTPFSTATDTASITVTAVNDAPVIGNLGGDSLGYSEGAGAVVIDQVGVAATIADLDSTDFAGGTLAVTIAAGEDAAEDVIAISTAGTVSLSAGMAVGSTVSVGGVAIGTIASNGAGGADLIVSFNANATPARVQTLVQAITYENTDTDNPTTGARTIRLTVSDGDGGTSAAADVTVTVTAQNDAPVNTVPGAQTVASGAALVLPGANAISIADVDAGATVQVTLNATNGTVTLNGATGLTFSNGDGTADAAMTFTGSIAAINTALNGLAFSPAAGYVGAGASLQIITDDQGGTGAGGAQTDNDTVAITVTGFDISGTILHDVDGDADVSLGDGTLTFAGATVHLYLDDGDGVIDGGDGLVATTATNGSGQYSFLNRAAGTYWVVVDSTTLDPGTATNPGYDAGWIWAEQTYGDDATTAALVLGARFGGLNANVSDAAGAASPLGSEHVSRVTLAGANVAGVDSGFSFNVVTNLLGGDAQDDSAANRTVQGSLRQFIENANAIAGDNAMCFVPASGVATNATDGAGNDWWRITVTRELPQITDAGTTIDGTAYYSTSGPWGSAGVAVRNTNTSVVGYVGAVGIGVDMIAGSGDETTLAGVQGPELELVAGDFRGLDGSSGVFAGDKDDDVLIGLDIQANDATVRRIAIHGFGNDDTNNADLSGEGDIRVGVALAGDTGPNYTGTLIEYNVIGAGPTVATFVDPGANNRSVNGVLAAGADDGILRYNAIGFAGRMGAFITNQANGWTITGNDFRGNAIEHDDQDGLAIGHLAGGATVMHNYFFQNLAQGVDLYRSTGGNTITDNTFLQNGQGVSETNAVRLYGTSNTVSYNLIQNTKGSGVVVVSPDDGSATAASTGNLISRNSFSGNGGNSIDLVAYTGPGAWKVENGMGDGVTPNDGTTDANDGNLGLDAPVIASALNFGATTTVSGTAWNGAGPVTSVEVYRAAAGAGDGAAPGFGEGLQYLGTAPVVGGNWSLVISGLAIGDSLTAIAMTAANDTSEFGSNVAVVAGDTTAPTLAGFSSSSAAGTYGLGAVIDVTATMSEAVQAGAQITVTLDTGDAVVLTAAADGTTLTGTYTVGPLDNSADLNVVSFVIDGVQDLAGNPMVDNTIPAGQNLADIENLVVDTTAPAAPSVPDLDAGSDSGVSSADDVTNDPTPTFSGTAEAGATVSVYDGAALLGTTVAAAGGTWSFTSGALAAGAHSISATATDAAGNVSAASGALAITLDTTAPALSSATVNGATLTLTYDETLGAIVPVAGDFVVNVNAAPVAVSAVNVVGSTVVLTLAAGVTNVDVVTVSYTAGATPTQDVAGNNAANLVNQAVTNSTGDTFAPAAPASVDLVDASDSGASNADDLTNVTTPTVRVTLAGAGATAPVAGDTVTVYSGAANVGSVVLNATDIANGWVELTLAPLGADGVKSLTATVTDLSLNVSGASPALAITLDTTPPAPTIALDAAITADDVVNATEAGATIAITGTVAGDAQIGDTVTLTINGVNYTGAVAAGNTFSIDVAGSDLAADANATIDASISTTDLAGNAGLAADTESYTVDTTAPAAPSVTSMTNDSGAAGDGITSDNALVFDGTAEAGSTVTVYVNGNPVGTTVADGAGNWSFDYTGTTLADGDYTVTATATDAAGNTGPASAGFSLTVDTTAPAAPTVDGLLTNDTTPTITGTLGAPLAVGEVFTVTVDGVTYTNGDGNLSVAGTNWMLTIPPGNAIVVDGTYPVVATVTDAAGNATSDASTNELVIDTTAPAQPGAPDLAAGSDTGASGTDDLTNDTTPTLTGTAEANSTVSIYDGAVLLGTTVADGAGNWSFTTPVLGEGGHTITVTATDAAGNVSVASPPLAITIDTTAPALASLTSSAAAGTYGVGAVIDVTATMSEAVQAGAQITVTLDTGDTVVLTAAANGTTLTGTYTVSAGDNSPDLNVASFVIGGVQDLAGNAMSSTVIPAGQNLADNEALVIDTTAPAQPGAPDLTAGSDTGISNADDVTSDTTPTLTGGGAEPGSTITIVSSIDGVLGTTLADALGNWTFTPPAPLADGTHTITVTATDAVGNVSPLSPALTITVDSTAPAAPTVNNVTSPTALPVLTGTATLVPGETLTVTVNGATYTVTPDGLGNWTLDLGVAVPTSGVLGAFVDNNTYPITATVTDLAGNATSAVGNVTIAINDAPVVTTSGGALAYTENAAATAIDPGLAVSDVDNATLASATVQITGGYVPGEDSLTFVSVGGITGSWNAATGTLALTGPATVADWQTVLRSVAYQNASENPNIGARTVTFVVDDGGLASAPATATINVASVNDAPTLTANTLTLGDGATVTFSLANLGASDVDDAWAGLTYNVTAIANGQFELVGAPGVAVTNFTAGQIAAGQVQFVHNGSNVAPSFSVTVSDASAVVGPFAASISFNATPSAPAQPPVNAGNDIATPRPTDGGAITVAAATSSVLPTATVSDVATAVATAFLRGPAQAAAGAGDGQFAEATGPAVAAPASGAVRAESAVIQTVPTPAPDSRFGPLRAEPGVIDTAMRLVEAKAEAMRGELKVALSDSSLSDEEERREIDIVLGGLRISGLALSAGAVWWAARAAGLMASLLSVTPAWRHVDPLPVLGRGPEADDEDEPEQDKEKRDEEHRARWILDESGA